MNAAEIILLILGFLSISISFFVGKKEKNSDPSETAEYQSRDIWTEKEEAMVRGQIEAVLSEERENVIAETTDQLNRKSNEKIMEFDEFSAQLMEKIIHNHEEVVFMYNMQAVKPEAESRKHKEGSANEMIIQMYKKGKSVLDISKELGIGQGEVKLMISLYGGNK